jgi:hypothetical protein
MFELDAGHRHGAVFQALRVRVGRDRGLENSHVILRLISIAAGFTAAFSSRAEVRKEEQVLFILLLSSFNLFYAPISLRLTKRQG